MATGDLISQVAIEKRNTSNYDVIRTMKFAGLGLVFVVRHLFP